MSSPEFRPPMVLRAPDDRSVGGGTMLDEEVVGHGENLSLIIDMLTKDGVFLGDVETLSALGNCDPRNVEKLLRSRGLHPGRGDRNAIWATKESHTARVTPAEVVKSLGHKFDDLKSLFHREDETLFEKDSGVRLWTGRTSA